MHKVWTEFTEQRRKFQAEVQLLGQPYDLNETEIIIHLHNPVQETILANLKIDLTTFLREKLRNSGINVHGELRQAEAKKIIYTNREKFDYLVNKNPILREMKDRLGLDTDF